MNRYIDILPLTSAFLAVTNPEIIALLGYKFTSNLASSEILSESVLAISFS